MNLLPEHIQHAMWGSLNRMPRLIYELEEKRLSLRFLQSLGIGACPVHIDICISEEKLDKEETIDLLDKLKCCHKDLMRSSMEACGIDVFKILENAGYDPAVLKDYINSFVLFDMVFGLKSFLNRRFACLTANNPQACILLFFIRMQNSVAYVCY